MRALWLVVLLAGCESTAEPARTPTRIVETVVEQPAAAPRHEVMARKVIAAIAANDLAALRGLSSPMILGELGDLWGDSLRRLREKLAEAGIDLAKAKLVRTERSGSDIETVDIYLEHGGRTFKTHFNVMTTGGRYDFMGFAVFFTWQ